MRVVCYGGGVQSTALLVLAKRGVLDFEVFLMANVGDDSEHPATLRYVREVAAPYAAAHGLQLHLLDRYRRDGTVETLWGRLTRDGSRSLPIPVRMANGAPGTRSCTADFKIKVTGRWLRRHGATAAAPATVAVGISLDEIHRANTRRAEPHERLVYPLIGVGEETGLRLTRADCARLIRAEGLPVPPKSSCFFCPFHRPSTWADQARDEPELFARCCALEDLLNERRHRLGRDPVFLTRYGLPLRQAIGTNQPLLFAPADDDAGCDAGWCMT